MNTHLENKQQLKRDGRGERGEKEEERDLLPWKCQKLNEKLEFKLHILKPGHNLQYGRESVRSKRVGGGRSEGMHHGQLRPRQEPWSPIWVLKVLSLCYQHKKPRGHF